MAYGTRRAEAQAPTQQHPSMHRHWLLACLCSNALDAWRCEVRLVTIVPRALLEHLPTAHLNSIDTAIKTHSMAFGTVQHS
jgi:hypothetical protein